MKLDKIFCDVDGVLLHTVQAVVDIYNSDYQFYSKFEPVDWTTVNTWNFKECQCMSKKELYTIFKSKRFFDTVRPMPGATDALRQLSDTYKINTVTLGSKPNLNGKRHYLLCKNREFKESIDDYIGLDSSLYFDKSNVNMHDGIFIDDSESNLLTSNAPIKICFGDVYSWNENWNGYRCYNWNDVLLFIKKLEEGESLEEYVSGQY